MLTEKILVIHGKTLESGFQLMVVIFFKFKYSLGINVRCGQFSRAKKACNHHFYSKTKDEYYTEIS